MKPEFTFEEPMINDNAHRMNSRLDDALDRRGKPRIYKPFPAKVTGLSADNQKFEDITVIDNISSSGVYLRLSRRVEIRAKLTITVWFSDIPVDRMSTAKASLRGEVLRVEPCSDGKFGVAVAITSRRFFH
jgi:hypothetical protein